MITTISLAKIGLYAVSTLSNTLHINFHYKIDCSHLRDPIGQAKLRDKTGKDAEVQAFMMDDPRIKAILHSVKMIAAEKDAWTAIAFHDPHGRYISASLAELAGKELDSAGYQVCIQHPWIAGQKT